MTAQEIYEKLSATTKGAFLEIVSDIAQPYIVVDAMRVHEVAAQLFELGFTRLLMISGIDYEGIDEKGRGKHREIGQYEEDGTVRPVEEPASGDLGVVYHVESWEHNSVIVMKVRVAREEARVESVSAVWPIALWAERETYDFYGIEFLNHPDLRRILLPEDWEGWPLRKDYEMPKIYLDVLLEGLSLAVREQD